MEMSKASFEVIPCGYDLYPESDCGVCTKSANEGTFVVCSFHFSDNDSVAYTHIECLRSILSIVPEKSIDEEFEELRNSYLQQA